MFRKMRRFKQLLSEDEAKRIIDEAQCGVLGVIGDDGYPYTVPVTHVRVDDKIYFHSAKGGHKIDAIKENPKVSFSFVGKNDIVGPEFTTYFSSAHVFGHAHIVEDDEERNCAFRALGEKTCSDGMYRFDEVMAKEASLALIICVDIEHITGKAAMELLKDKK